MCIVYNDRGLPTCMGVAGMVGKFKSQTSQKFQIVTTIGPPHWTYISYFRSLPRKQSIGYTNVSWTFCAVSNKSEKFVLACLGMLAMWSAECMARIGYPFDEDWTMPCTSDGLRPFVLGGATWLLFHRYSEAPPPPPSCPAWCFFSIMVSYLPAIAFSLLLPPKWSSEFTWCELLLLLPLGRCWWGIGGWVMGGACGEWCRCEEWGEAEEGTGKGAEVDIGEKRWWWEEEELCGRSECKLCGYAAGTREVPEEDEGEGEGLAESAYRWGGGCCPDCGGCPCW